MSDEQPDPWSKPAYGGGSTPPPPEPPRPPAPPTTAVPPTAPPPPPGSRRPDPASQPTSAVPVTAGRGQQPPGGPVPPLGGDVPPGSGGAGRPIALGIAIGLLIALVVGMIAFALTRDDDDSASEETDLAPTTTILPDTLPQETTTTVAETTVPTTVPETTTTVAETTTTGPDPSGWPSGLVLAVAADDGIRLVGPNGANTVAVNEAVDIALPLAGTDSYVVQSTVGRFGGGAPDDTAIRLVGPNGSTMLIDPPPDLYLRLHDVRSANGSPVVLYSDDVGDNPDNQIESLHQFTVADTSIVDFGQIGGWEAGTSRIHIGGVTNVGEFFAEATSGLLSVRQDGTSIDPATVGLEESYADCSTCPRRFTITPSGQQLAWLDGNELVVTDLGTGAEVLRAGVPGDIASTVSDISLNGGIAILNRTVDGIVGSENASAIIVDLRGAAPVFVDVRVPGFASR